MSSGLATPTSFPSPAHPPQQTSGTTAIPAPMQKSGTAPPMTSFANTGASHVPKVTPPPAGLFGPSSQQQNMASMNALPPTPPPTTTAPTGILAGVPLPQFVAEGQTASKSRSPATFGTGVKHLGLPTTQIPKASQPVPPANIDNSMVSLPDLPRSSDSHMDSAIWKVLVSFWLRGKSVLTLS